MHRNAAVVEFENVSKYYLEGGARVTALRNVDLVLSAGDFATVMGPSGGGKTTLLNCIGGLDTPDEGEILLKGRPTKGMDDRELTRLRREEIGFVFQFFNLLPTLSVYENVELPLLLGRRTKEGGERIRTLLDYVGLLGRAASFPAELSGGEMQRVAIARALVHRPSLLLADEPTGNLDSENGERILEIMQAAAGDFNTTVVIATHNPRMTSAGNRHFQIRDGRLSVHA
jgi:putative ABC transport system ATP-binding protein